jgi:hypothetical protein
MSAGRAPGPACNPPQAMAGVTGEVELRPVASEAARRLRMALESLPAPAS